MIVDPFAVKGDACAFIDKMETDHTLERVMDNLRKAEAQYELFLESNYRTVLSLSVKDLDLFSLSSFLKAWRDLVLLSHVSHKYAGIKINYDRNHHLLKTSDFVKEIVQRLIELDEFWHLLSPE